MGSIGRAFALLVFAGSAGPATACVVLAGPSFLNYCGYTVVVRYATQGADCTLRARGWRGGEPAGPLPRVANTSAPPPHAAYRDALRGVVR